MRDEMAPALERYVEPTGIKEVRGRLRLSQAQFARLIGIPRTTLQNWEQGRTEPDAPAKALLKVAAKHPEAVLDALHGKARERLIALNAADERLSGKNARQHADG